MFKTYARRIDVYYRNELTNGEWRYAYSSNAYLTCKDAVAAAKPNFPNSDVRAWFATK